ncbi:sigma-70 family RNA polymerase sigma factor [Mucilaginibacter sp. JRF]|uniref:RNA polymerase sigma factor n=1 Tax=Mucilaginibacter sp. JRF TaxID=2780088 RepID=UPI00187E373D|nr:sigma-70 family RNA polymerase sigma factor [Mucilaginibacter sp. JRF]MBE9586649.1 sigma-70 family RNA polymerase sigma factor [Mucilaginibacter sp. JRF]
MAKIFRSDEDLWHDILAGDDRAFAEFYDRYWLRMYKAALYYLKDADASEEVVQEVFVLIWNKRHTLDIKNFAAYLNSSTRYEVYRRLKAAKSIFIELDESKISPLSVVYNKGDEKLNETDSTNILNECLQELPKRCREIFYMSKVKQLTNTEIAEQLGISKHTVENQLAVALKYLRVNLSKIAVLVLLLMKNP